MIMLSMQNAIFWFASHSDLTGGSQLSVEAIPYGNSTMPNRKCRDLLGTAASASSVNLRLKIQSGELKR